MILIFDVMMIWYTVMLEYGAPLCILQGCPILVSHIIDHGILTEHPHTPLVTYAPH